MKTECFVLAALPLKKNPKQQKTHNKKTHQKKPQTPKQKTKTTTATTRKPPPMTKKRLLLEENTNLQQTLRVAPPYCLSFPSPPCYNTGFLDQMFINVIR